MVDRITGSEDWRQTTSLPVLTFGSHKNKGCGDAWWLLPFYCCSLQMDQCPSPVPETGCRYLTSVVKFVIFCFLSLMFFFSLGSCRVFQLAVIEL